MVAMPTAQLATATIALPLLLTWTLAQGSARNAIQIIIGSHNHTLARKFVLPAIA
jgi:hypothetical protein